MGFQGLRELLEASRFVVHKERAPGTDTSQDKTRREEATTQLLANSPNKMQAHSLWVRLPSRPQLCCAPPTDWATQCEPLRAHRPRTKQTRNQLTEQRFLRALRRVHRSLESQPLPQIWTRNVGMARRSCRPQSTMSRREASLAFVSISTCRARPGRAFPFGAAMRRAGFDPWMLEAKPWCSLDEHVVRRILQVHPDLCLETEFDDRSCCRRGCSLVQVIDSVMVEIGWAWNDDSTGMSRSLLRSPIRAFNTANPSLKGYPPGRAPDPEIFIAHEAGLLLHSWIAQLGMGARGLIIIVAAAEYRLRICGVKPCTASTCVL